LVKLSPETSEWDAGVNRWLKENMVFKLDYEFQDVPANEKEAEGQSLCVGATDRFGRQ
jgi:hypothetical protein